MIPFLHRVVERYRTRRTANASSIPQERANQPTQSADAEYSGDQPIKHRGQDRFSRWPFAERIARTLAERQDPSSVVVGIYGAWGDGKTSTLSLMQEALAAYSNAVVVPFNPWRFESQEQLLRSFFDTLATRLGNSLPTRTEEVGKVLRRYGRILSVLSVGAGPITISGGDAVERLGEALSTVELDELKTRVEKILTETGKRVVVFIDDIDRLDRSEIQAIFKLVKLSASFDYMSYVLAFDDAMVADALGEKYGAGGSNAGRAFLEKIVQVPLHLPPADELALRKLTFEGVDAALKLSGIDLTNGQVQAFVRHFIDGLEPRVRTPRQARLYGNVLAFAMPILKGEVNPVDQMLIEGVRILYPNLYVLIRDQREIFMTRRQERGPGDARKRQALELIDAALAGTGVSSHVVIEGLLKMLFPRIETLLGNATYGNDWDKQWERDQRICSEQYSDRYFRYGVPSGDVSDRAVAAFVEKAQSASEAELQADLARVGDTDGIRKMIAKLRRLEDTMAVEAAARLAVALARAGNLIPREKAMLFDDWTMSQAGILISQLVRRTPAGAERDNLARRVIREAEPLVFGSACFRWLRKDKKESDEARIVSPEVEDELGRLLAERIHEASEGPSLFKTFGEDTAGLLWIWKRYGSSEAVRNYLHSRLKTNPGEVDHVLSAHVGTAWGLESGLSHKGDFERDNYNAIVALIDPQVIYDTLKARYPELSGAEYPYAGDSEDGPRLAEQFAFVHRKAIEDAKSARETKDEGESKPDSS